MATTARWIHSGSAEVALVYSRPLVARLCVRPTPARCHTSTRWPATVSPPGESVSARGVASAPSTLESGKADVANPTAVSTTEPNLALERLDHHVGKVNAGDALGAAESARAEDVDLHEFVAHDVESDQKHAVGHELRARQFGEGQHVVCHFDGLGSATHMHIRAWVRRVVHTSKSGVRAVALQRRAVHREQADIAVRGVRQLLLGDDVPVAQERLDDLAEIGRLVVGDEEDPAATGTLEGLQHG